MIINILSLAVIFERTRRGPEIHPRKGQVRKEAELTSEAMAPVTVVPETLAAQLGSAPPAAVVVVYWI